MIIQVRARGVELTPKLHNHVERHARFALTRFGDRVLAVRVRLTDVNGPKGGRDIECRVVADLAAGGQAVVTELQVDPHAASARALDRLGHAVSRRLERVRDRWRGKEFRGALHG